MNQAKGARAVLALDALGCAAAAGLVAVVPTALRPIDPGLRSRRPVVAALTLTAATCMRGAWSPRPSPASMRTAALVNGGWVAACLIALPRQREALGATLLALTAAMDAAAGELQWALSRSDPSLR